MITWCDLCEENGRQVFSLYFQIRVTLWFDPGRDKVSYDASASGILNAANSMLEMALVKSFMQKVKNIWE